MVLIAGIALLIALVISSALGGFAEMMTESYPRSSKRLVWLEASISYGLMPLVFSLMFWLVPATKVEWKDAWPAGILTAVLIASSRYLINLYLQFSTTSEVYGAAGSLVVLLVWIYATGLAVFLGASFSRSWAMTFGSRSKSDATVVNN
jgi:membrane protein